MNVTLTPEEKYLWHCARHWRQPQPLAQPGPLDWHKAVDLAIANRMQTVLAGSLKATGLRQQLPPAAETALEEAVSDYEQKARRLGEDLHRYLHHAAQRGQEVVVLKGLWLSCKIYGQASARPGGDIDVLVREQDIPEALAILEEKMAYGRWWRPLLDDRYYQRHHLHQQRCNHDRSIWFEPHWRFDHPYNRLTIDYQGLMDRTSPGQLLGKPVREMSWPDLLLSLAIHLVKHAVYLPGTLHRTDLPRLILADGMLMYFVDVAEVIKQQQGEIDWQLTVDLARQGGATDVLGAVLHVCHHRLQAPVPAQVRQDLAVQKPGPVAGVVMNRIADYKITTYQGKESNPFWRLMLGYNESIVFRPIRLLDLVLYCFPGRDYLRRRYGRASAVSAVSHLLRALVGYLRLGADTVYFIWQRRRRLKRLDEKGVTWP